MALPNFDALNFLSTPVWVVSPESQEVLFANRAALALCPERHMDPLRHGPLSAHAQFHLDAYLPVLVNQEQVVEILTVQKFGKSLPLSCRLSTIDIGGQQPAIVFEGLSVPEVAPPSNHTGWGASATPPQSSDEHQFYERLFRTNTAPMLLIDPADDGRIVDANLAATRFYGYPRDEMCLKHTWDINTLGRDVLPIMHEVAKLPGGHKPLNFTHRMADGSHRQVQTYAGPVELNQKRLMLCIIHDITEQKRLERELQQAALRDPLTGLWNRRQFMNLVDHAHAQTQRYGHAYSLLLIDVDHFKDINDRCGHHKGDEVLLSLAKTLESRVRESDTVCRWGGEEFVILLPHTTLEGAMKVAESLRETVEGMRLSEVPPLTVSIGVAQHVADEDSETLFKRVDEALYRAKATGRNKVMPAA